MTRAAEFYQMDPDELENRLVEARRELLNLRFQLATGQLDNVAQLKNVRRDVARVLTVLREMEIAESEGVPFEAPAPQPARERAQRRDQAAAEELRTEEIETEDVDEDEPPVAPTRARRSRKVADPVDIEDVDQDAEGDVDLDVDEDEPPVAPTRARRSRKVADVTDQPPEVAGDTAEPAPTRSRRRSRKVDNTAQEPADADEEQ